MTTPRRARTRAQLPDLDTEGRLAMEPLPKLGLDGEPALFSVSRAGSAERFVAALAVAARVASAR